MDALLWRWSNSIKLIQYLSNQSGEIRQVKLPSIHITFLMARTTLFCKTYFLKSIGRRGLLVRTVRRRLAGPSFGYPIGQRCAAMPRRGRLVDEMTMSGFLLS
jgi:hypothetical protein